MSLHLKYQIEKLKKLIIQLGSLVEEAVAGAIRAVDERDSALAQRIVDGDTRIDTLEIDVEEECLHTLALHQPVAMDLRYVVAILKINNDLERIADQAVNIAQQALALNEEAALEVLPFDLRTEAATARMMLKQALDGLIHVDADLADAVRGADENVDRIHRNMYRQVKEAIQKNPALTDQLIRYISVSKNLERIADLATNIAEDVIYMVRGDILRHLPPSDHQRFAPRNS